MDAAASPSLAIRRGEKSGPIHSEFFLTTGIGGTYQKFFERE
jgi:hypothetical protein